METEILEDLGLTQAEIKVYLTLLEIGSSTAGPILEKSKLQNSVVHRALNTLIEKGIINYILEGRRKIYQATDPEHFYNYIEDKKQRFTDILPELKKKQHLAKKKQDATIYHGMRGIKEVYAKLLDSSGKEYNTFGGGKRVTYQIMGETWWKNFHTRRIAKKIPARQVFDETIRTFGETLNKRRLSKVKFLSQEYEQLTETIIMGPYVAIVIFTDNPYALLIEDRTVVNGYKKNFELIWRKAHG